MHWRADDRGEKGLFTETLENGQFWPRGVCLLMADFQGAWRVKFISNELLGNKGRNQWNSHYTTLIVVIGFNITKTLK